MKWLALSIVIVITVVELCIGYFVLRSVIRLRKKSLPLDLRDKWSLILLIQSTILTIVMWMNLGFFLNR